jgi:hypothetical protein
LAEDKGSQPKLSETDAALEDVFKQVEADMLAKLGAFVDEFVGPLLTKSTPEQRADLTATVNAYMVEETDDEARMQKLNDDIEAKVLVLVTQELDEDASEAHDALCDKVCDALDEAVDETAVYGQMKGHEMMSAMLGIESTGPVRVENGEVLTTVAMGGAIRNPDGSWTEFDTELGKQA